MEDNAHVTLISFHETNKCVHTGFINMNSHWMNWVYNRHIFCFISSVPAQHISWPPWGTASATWWTLRAPAHVVRPGGGECSCVGEGIENVFHEIGGPKQLLPVLGGDNHNEEVIQVPCANPHQVHHGTVPQQDRQCEETPRNVDSFDIEAPKIRFKIWILPTPHVQDQEDHGRSQKRNPPKKIGHQQLGRSTENQHANVIGSRSHSDSVRRERVSFIHSRIFTQ